MELLPQEGAGEESWHRAVPRACLQPLAGRSQQGRDPNSLCNESHHIWHDNVGLQLEQDVFTLKCTGPSNRNKNYLHVCGLSRLLYKLYFTVLEFQKNL